MEETQYTKNTVYIDLTAQNSRMKFLLLFFSLIFMTKTNIQ